MEKKFERPLNDWKNCSILEIPIALNKNTSGLIKDSFRNFSTNQGVNYFGSDFFHFSQMCQ